MVPLPVLHSSPLMSAPTTYHHPWRLQCCGMTPIEQRPRKFRAQLLQTLPVSMSLSKNTTAYLAIQGCAVNKAHLN